MKQIFYLGLILIFTSCERSKVVFDIPPLIGKNIDEIRNILKIPEVKQVGPLDTTRITENSMLKKDGYLLIIEYYIKNRKVRRFSIISEEKDFDRYENILKLGNLDSTSTEYYVESDNAFDLFGDYNNIEVYPK